MDKGNVRVCGGFVGLCVVLMAQAAVAGWDPATRTYDHTGYVSLKENVNESGSTASFEAGTNWEDGKPPEKGKCYYVPDPKALFSVERPRIGGHRYTVTADVKDNGDGTQTLVARAVRGGLVLVFR